MAHPSLILLIQVYSNIFEQYEYLRGQKMGKGGAGLLGCGLKQKKHWLHWKYDNISLALNSIKSALYRGLRSFQKHLYSASLSSTVIVSMDCQLGRI